MEVCRCGHPLENHKPAGGFPVAQVRNVVCSGHGEVCECREGCRPEGFTLRSDGSDFLSRITLDLFENNTLDLPENKEGRYAKCGREIGQLVEAKNKSYGSAFDRAGEILKILYPEGIKPEQYVDALGITRVLDKLFRISNGNNFGQEDAWTDLAGYGILGAVRTSEEKTSTNKENL